MRLSERSAIPCGKAVSWVKLVGLVGWDSTPLRLWCRYERVRFFFSSLSLLHHASEGVMEKVDLLLKNIYFSQKESGLHTDRNTFI